MPLQFREIKSTLMASHFAATQRWETTRRFIASSYYWANLHFGSTGLIEEGRLRKHLVLSKSTLPRMLSSRSFDWTCNGFVPITGAIKFHNGTPGR